MARKRKGWIIYVAEIPSGSRPAYAHLTENQPLGMLPPQSGHDAVERALVATYQAVVFSASPASITAFAQSRRPLGGTLDWSRKFPLAAYDWNGLPVLHAERVDYWLDADHALTWSRLPYPERR